MRKDVKRALGSITKCWHILKYPIILAKTKKMSEVIYTYIILHDIILEDEGNMICEYDDKRRSFHRHNHYKLEANNTRQEEE